LITMLFHQSVALRKWCWMRLPYRSFRQFTQCPWRSNSKSHLKALLLQAIVWRLIQMLDSKAKWNSKNISRILWPPKPSLNWRSYSPRRLRVFHEIHLWSALYRKLMEGRSTWRSTLPSSAVSNLPERWSNPAFPRVNFQHVPSSLSGHQLVSAFSEKWVNKFNASINKGPIYLRSNWLQRKRQNCSSCTSENSNWGW